MDDFVKKVEQTILSEALIPEGPCVVVGLSGGADSTALTFALFELREKLGLHLAAAHLNHGLRGRESDEDEKLVRDFADRLGISLYVEKLDSPPSSDVEQWARQRRYEFLVRTALSAKAQAVAVGHHADDVAETFLINLLRGAAGAGLSEMAPARPALPYSENIMIVRPLLRVFRSEVRDYLARRGLSWREDSSNAAPRFMRNRVRHEVMPLLEKINPSVARVLSRNAEVFRKEHELCRSLAEDWLDDNAREDNDSIRFCPSSLLSAPAGLCLAVLRESLRRVKGDLRSVSQVHVDDLLALIKSDKPGASLDLPGVRAYLDKNKVVLQRTEKEDSGVARKYRAERKDPVEGLLLEVPGALEWQGPGGRSYHVSAQISEVTGPADLFCEVYLDPSGLRGALRVRRFQSGERFHPGGRTKRKLKKFMNELGIPWRDREVWPLIEDEEGLVWVPGLEPAARARAQAGSRSLRVRISPSPGEFL